MPTDQYASRRQRTVRSVPGALSAWLQFGGVGAVGWFVAAFGATLSAVFVNSADLSQWRFSVGPIEQVEAIVTRVEETSSSINDEKVFRYDYRFVMPEGDALIGSSYTVPSSGRSPQVGQTVTVEYLTASPQISRIAGMRRKPFGPEILFVLIFPIVGLGLAGYFWTRGRQSVALLARGREAQAALSSEEITSYRVNSQQLYRLTMLYEDEDGRVHEVKKLTANPQLYRGRADVPILYDPRRPTRVLLIEDMPGIAVEQTTVRSNATAAAWLSLLAPALFVTACIIGLWAAGG